MTWTHRLSLAAALLLIPAAGVAEAQPPPAGCVAVSRPGLVAESPPGRIAFDAGLSAVPLVPACGPALSEQVRAAGAKRFILLADDMRARQGSDTVFTLRLAGKAGAEALVVGAVNFFAAPKPEAPGAPRRVSFDVTVAVQALARAGALDDGLVVRVKGDPSPAAGAGMSLGRLQLVAE